MTVERSTSATTLRARAFVERRRPDAERLGLTLADEIHDPTGFAARLRAGLAELADPEYRAGQQLVAPGIGATHGVRTPLLTAVAGRFRRATRGVRPAPLVDVAARLLGERELEARWFAFGLLERTVAADPERSWQLLRRASAEAGDWITVDTLARPVGRGILAEPFRWAELEQLVYSPSRWERRLVGSAVATVPHLDRTRGRTPDVARRGLGLVAELIGDAEADVKKALAWALRELALVDRPAVAAFLRDEADRAKDSADGHRARVVRDALPRLTPSDASVIRERLAGIRTRPGAPSTSRAARASASFLGLGLETPPADRPIIPRPVST